jgi:hypothetical protein
LAFKRRQARLRGKDPDSDKTVMRLQSELRER